MTPPPEVLDDENVIIGERTWKSCCPWLGAGARGSIHRGERGLAGGGSAPHLGRSVSAGAHAFVRTSPARALETLGAFNKHCTSIKKPTGALAQGKRSVTQRHHCRNDDCPSATLTGRRSLGIFGNS